MELHRKDEQLQPTDLVGCRYRLVQRRRLPGIAPTPASQQRAERTEEARQDVFSLLPRDVTRVDARPEHAEVDTLEGLVNEASIITGAELTGPGWRAPIDALVRHSDGTYTPVAVSNHRVARPWLRGQSRHRRWWWTRGTLGWPSRVRLTISCVTTRWTATGWRLLPAL